MKRMFKAVIGISLASATLIACSDSEEKKAADFCTLVADAAVAQQGLVTLLNSGDIPPPPQVKTQLTTFRNLLSKMADVAPEVLADDMILVVNGFTAFDLGLQKVDYDYMRLLTDPEAATEAQADMAALEALETQDAMTALGDYTFTNCGARLDLSGD